MRMNRKSTLFYLVNDFEKGGGDMEDLDVKMEFQSPSDKAVRAILAFAQSYCFVQSQTIEGIDLYLN